MLHAHSSSPPESPTWRALSSLSLHRSRLSVVKDARSIACCRDVLTAGTPPRAGCRPAGPECVSPGQQGSAEA